MSLEKILLKIEQNFSISYILLSGLLLFMLWASIFDIDKALRTQGVVVASANNQVVQVADGGVLASLLVLEGEEVIKGQLLATLENQRIKSNYNQISADIAYLKASISRIDAQILRKDIVFDDSVKKYPDFIQSQRSLYLQQKKSLKQKTKLLELSLKIAQEQLKITQKLIETDDVSKLEALQIREKILDIKFKIMDIFNTYQNRIKTEKEKFVSQLSINQYKLEQQKDILKHSSIYTPITGVVKDLKITTLGGVLKAGEVLMEISPSNGGIIIEAKVLPSEIADIKIGMQVVIKLDSFDYTIFGALDGKVGYISSDTLLEKNQNGKEQSFYQIDILITSKNDKIKPKFGMSATIEIKTGKRSLFNYLTKPITRGFSGALSEK